MPEGRKPFKEYSGRMIEIADNGTFLVNHGTEAEPSWTQHESFKKATEAVDLANATERKAKARSLSLAALTDHGEPRDCHERLDVAYAKAGEAAAAFKFPEA